jgi:hypothetical protein
MATDNSSYIDQSGNATGYNADMATAMRRASQGAWGAAYPTGPAKPVKPVWTKAGVIHTANGDIDVDANGLAADGSKPVAVVDKPVVPTARKAISSSVVTINGQQKQIITFDDGTTTTQDLGTDTANQAARTNIFDAAKTQMKTWGLYKEGDKASDALLKQLQDLATSGAGADTISLALQQSDAYKARFIGNATRQANGMSVLSPAQYIQWENDLQSVLQAAGVPKGFYAGTDEMAKLIGANVNYQVLQNRVDLAAKSIADTDPFYTQQLQNLYGVSQGDMIAHVLDPSVAMPLLQKQVAATTVAAEAARQGTNINLSTAEQLAGQGVTQAQAQQGFQAIAAQEPAIQALASRYAGYGAAGDQGAALQTAIFGAPGTQTQAQAEAQLKRLQTQEASTFGGSAGAGKGSLGIADTSGLS